MFWDVVNLCPLVVFVGGIRSRCPCSGVWLLTAVAAAHTDINSVQLAPRNRRPQLVNLTEKANFAIYILKPKCSDVAVVIQEVQTSCGFKKHDYVFQHWPTRWESRHSTLSAVAAQFLSHIFGTRRWQAGRQTPRRKVYESIHNSWSSQSCK